MGLNTYKSDPEKLIALYVKMATEDSTSLIFRQQVALVSFGISSYMEHQFETLFSDNHCSC